MIEVTTELRDMFSYSPVPFLISTIILILIFLQNKHIPKKAKKKPTTIPTMTDKKTNIQEIKTNYLKQLQTLSENYQNHKITNKTAYQKLSKIIRNFIFETTNKQVQNYTLSEIKNVNIPILYKLVSEYYEPEFSKNTEGNILESIDKTRKVIEKWK